MIEALVRIACSQIVQDDTGATYINGSVKAVSANGYVVGPTLNDTYAMIAPGTSNAEVQWSFAPSNADYDIIVSPSNFCGPQPAVCDIDTGSSQTQVTWSSNTLVAPIAIRWVVVQSMSFAVIAEDITVDNQFLTINLTGAAAGANLYIDAVGFIPAGWEGDVNTDYLAAITWQLQVLILAACWCVGGVIVRLLFLFKNQRRWW